MIFFPRGNLSEAELRFSLINFSVHCDLKVPRFMEQQKDGMHPFFASLRPPKPVVVAELVEGDGGLEDEVPLDSEAVIDAIVDELLMDTDAAEDALRARDDEDEEIAHVVDLEVNIIILFLSFYLKQHDFIIIFL